MTIFLPDVCQLHSHLNGIRSRFWTWNRLFTKSSKFAVKATGYVRVLQTFKNWVVFEIFKSFSEGKVCSFSKLLQLAIFFCNASQMAFYLINDFPAYFQFFGKKQKKMQLEKLDKLTKSWRNRVFWKKKLSTFYKAFLLLLEGAKYPSRGRVFVI